VRRGFWSHSIEKRKEVHYALDPRLTSARGRKKEGKKQMMILSQS